jgi:hypothetical protein
MECGAELTEPDVFHTRRPCERCGRMTYKQPGETGLRVEAGDTPVIPAGAIRLSLDPRQATGYFTATGVSMFVRMLLGNKAATRPDEISDSLRSLCEAADLFIDESPLLSDLDLDSDDGKEAALRRLEEKKDSPEWFALLTGVFAKHAEEALAENDAAKTAWAVQQTMLAHAVLVFERDLKALVWRGYGNFGADQIS